MTTKTSLRDAFLEDHQKLTQGLSALVRLVENGEWKQAAQKAEELDRTAGPHIEFEEKRFYPQVSRSRGADYVDNLYDEHRSGREAIEALRASAGRTHLTDEERDRVLFDLRRALDHVVSCGTLLSHVTSLDDEEQEKLLRDLERYRKAGHRWTELSRVPKESRASGASGASIGREEWAPRSRQPRRSGRPPRAKSAGSEPSEERGEH